MKNKLLLILILNIFLISLASASLDNGLVGHWRFNAGTGTTAIDSAGLNNGTISGASWVTGKEGAYALNFDGVDDYVNLSKSAEMGTGNFTVSAWLKVNSGTSGFAVSNIRTGAIFEGWWLGLGSSNRIYAGFGNASSGTRISTYSNNNTYNFGEWIMATAIWNRNENLTIYVNGVQSGTSVSNAELSGQDINNIYWTLIGASYNGASNLFNGSIDDVRIYNRSLSATEVQSIYNSKILTTFSDGSSSGNLTFTGNKNITVNLTIPKYADVSNAFLSLGGYGIKTSIIDMILGSFDIESSYTVIASTSFQNVINVFDENWGTYGYSQCGVCTEILEVNYSKLLNSDGLKWEVKYNMGSDVIENLTLLASCFNYSNNIKLRIETQNVGGSVGTEYLRFKCYSGTWQTLKTLSVPAPFFQRIYEEKVHFFNYTQTFPDSSYLEVGTPDGTREWNYTGEFNTSQQTSSFASKLNSILSYGSCGLGSISSLKNCIIPLLFHSDTAGILQLSNLDILYGFPTLILNYLSPTQASNSTILNQGIEVNSSIGGGVYNIAYNLYNSSLPIENLVAYYSFDQNSSLVYDYSLNGNNGTAKNNVTWTKLGKLDGAFEFDGVDDYVNLSTNFILNDTGFTICSWVYPKSTTPRQRILEYYTPYGFSFRKETTNNIGFHILNSTDSSCSAYSLTGDIIINQWSFVCGVRDGSLNKLSVYVDGVSKSGVNCPSNFVMRTGTLLRAGASTVEFWNGSIDEVMIFNKSLSQEEITNLYNRNLVTKFYPYDENLVLMMNFDNESLLGENNTFVRDLSLYGNNGNVSNAILVSGKYNNAYSFNGTSGVHIDIYNNNSINLTSDKNFTISLWVNGQKALGNTATSVISFWVSSLRGIGLDMQIDGKIYFKMRNATNLATLSTPIDVSNSWTHITATYNKETNNMSLFINGTIISSVNGVLTLSPVRSKIGSCEIIGGNTACFNGSIDELRIYNKVLSQQEIQALYNSNLKKFNPTYWEFYINQANLSDGSYHYFVESQDTNDIIKSTTIRNINLYNLYVNLISPLNNTWSSIQKNFTCNASTQFINLKNATLFIWNSTNSIYNQTSKDISGLINQTSFNINFTYNNIFKWNCEFCNDEDYCGSNLNYTLNVDITTPITTLNFPNNNQWLNYNESIDFNCTVEGENLDTLFFYINSTGTWHSNQTKPSLVSGVTNNFKMNLSEGYYIWSCGANKSIDGGIVTMSQYGNYTVNIDTIFPLTNIISPTTGQTITGSSFDLVYNISDLNLLTYTYNIIRTSDNSSVYPINLSLPSPVGSVNIVFPNYGEIYKVYIWGKDKADHEAYSFINVLAQQEQIQIIGGGGGVSITKVKVIALQQPDIIVKFTPIQRAIIYAKIYNYTQTYPVLSQNNILSLQTDLKNIGIYLSLEDLQKFLDYFKDNKIEEIEVTEQEAKSYNLIKGAVVIKEREFVVNPRTINTYTFYCDSAVWEFPVSANKVFQSCEVVSGNFKCQVKSPTQVIISYDLSKLDPKTWIHNLEGEIKYISQTGEVDRTNIRTLNTINYCAEVELNGISINVLTILIIILSLLVVGGVIIYIKYKRRSR